MRLRLSTGGVFLLENGVELFLWVGKSASPTVVSALLGVPSLEGLDLSTVQLQVKQRGEREGGLLRFFLFFFDEYHTWLMVIFRGCLGMHV